MTALISRLHPGLLALVSCLLALPALAQQSSLDLDGTAFVDPSCAERTEWSVAVTTEDGPLEQPGSEAVSFQVVVTEGETRSVLRGSGDLVINNYGEIHAKLSSVALTLERPGAGGSFELLTAAVQNESAGCGSTAATCEGAIQGDPGSSLVLYDAESNDVIALPDLLPIPDTEPEDVPPLRLSFTYELDVTGLGLEAGDQLRTGVYVTFSGAGSRGGSDASCTVDANCNGQIDADDPGTPNVNESEEENYRTVWERSGFTMPACEATCDAVGLAAALHASDATCLGVSGSDLLESVLATGVEGTTTTFDLSGTVSCLNGSCEAAVVAEALLSCDEDPSAVPGTPSFAAISVVCDAGGPPSPMIQPGDFCSQTQGGWGTECRGSNPGCLRDDNFGELFPSGLVVGDQDGADGDEHFALVLESAAAVEAFLPAGGTAAALTADLTDPLMSAGGVLAGQAVAATLSVEFDAAGLRLSGDAVYPAGSLGTLVYADCVADALIGLSVRDVLALANVGLSGGDVSEAGVSLADLSDALAALNEEFVDCATAEGCLALPGMVSAAVSPDSDGGGESDARELEAGRDPLDAEDDIDLRGESAGDLAPPDDPDGTLNIADVLHLLRLVVEIEEITDENLARGDLSPALYQASQVGGLPRAWRIGDGALTVGDVWVLLRATVGLVEPAGS